MTFIGEKAVMESEKIVTFSIAAYNMERWLEPCIESLIDDSVMEQIEIIVVDDGSKDRTAKIAQEYVDRYPRSIKLISKVNGGYGSTINTSLSIAEGEFFKQVDGDDFIITEHLKEYLDVLRSTDADVVYTVGEYRYEDGSPTDTYNCHLTPRKEPYQPNEAADRINLHLHCATFRSSMLRKAKVNLPEHCMYTDLPLSLLGFCNATTVLSTPLHLYCSRIGRPGQSVSEEGYRKYVKDHARVTILVASMRFGDAQLENLTNRTSARLYSNTMEILLGMSPTDSQKTLAVSLDKDIQKLRPSIFKEKCIAPAVRLMHITGCSAYVPLHGLALVKKAVKRVLKHVVGQA